MAFDLDRIVQELQGAPLESPYPVELSSAVISDCLRRAGRATLSEAVWQEWLAQPARGRWARIEEQLGMVAHLLASTSLGDETIQAMRNDGSPAQTGPAAALAGFFDRVQPLTAEMIRSNAFRREELLRSWVAAWGGEVTGESPERQHDRLGQLDYRATLAEYARAEEARKEEAEKRERLLREEAAKREAEARAWRE
jgi:hypothetical protein